MLPLPILFLLVSFGSVGAVLFTPALPPIQNFFGLSIAQTQLTITSYLIGYALGQLPYGPLANRLGRKKALYIGVSIGTFGSILCALSSPLHSFTLLIVARFIQALGVCVGLKVSFTMIADKYDQKKATQIISKLILAFAIMPGISIAIGGWLTQHFSWESCFYFLTVFGLMMLGFISFLPETAKWIDPKALNLNAIYQAYHRKFRNKQLIISGLLMGCGTAVVYIFASKAPFIGINLIGLSPDVFGALNLIPPIGMLLGSLISIRLAGYFSVLKLLHIGTIACLISTLTMLIPFAITEPTVWSLFFPMVLIYIGDSIVYANSSSFGLATAKDKSNASAILNFLNIGTAVIALLLSEFIFPESAILMPISFMVFFLVMLGLYFRLKKIV